MLKPDTLETVIREQTPIAETLKTILPDTTHQLINTAQSVDSVVQQVTSPVVADTATAVQKLVEQASENSGSGNIGLAIAFIGLLIFAAHLFSEIFSRKRVPDVLLLMFLGLIIGPIFNWIKPESLGQVGGVFSQLTLVILLFESGTQLSFSQLTHSFKNMMTLTFSTFFSIILIIGLLGWLVFGLNPSISFMLGAILGGTSSAVVIPIVNQIQMGEKGRTILILESAFNDTLCIVFTLAFLESYKAGELNFGVMTGNILSSFILASIIGLIGAMVWSMLLERVRNIKNSIFTTPAFVFVIYGVNEVLGYSGAIAALAFGIGLANTDSFKKTFKKFTPKQLSQLNQTEKHLFSELVFLMKTFFFVFIGISIRLDNIISILIGLGITLIIILIRIPCVIYSLPRYYKDVSDRDRSYMAALIPKGLSAAVLATLIIQTNIKGADLISNIVFSVILFSITISSVLIPLVEKNPKISGLYIKMFDMLEKLGIKKAKEIKNTIETVEHKIEEKSGNVEEAEVKQENK